MERTWLSTVKPIDLDAIKVSGATRDVETDETNPVFSRNIPGLDARGLPFWRANE
jgi:hypothetical protein